MAGGVPISELTPAEHIYDGCCFPLVQYGETMKVEYQTFVKQMQIDFGFKSDNLSLTKMDTGIKTTDGRTIWRITVNTTVGNIEAALTALNVEMIIDFKGYALSNYYQWWQIPNFHAEAGYSIYFFKEYNVPTFGVKFGAYFNSTNPVYVIMDYTELPATAVTNNNANKGV